MAVPLLKTVNIKGSHVLADRAYGSKEIRSYITSQQAEYVIPPKTNAKEPWDVDWWLYKDRHLVASYHYTIWQACCVLFDFCLRCCHRYFVKMTELRDFSDTS